MKQRCPASTPARSGSHCGSAEGTLTRTSTRSSVSSSLSTKPQDVERFDMNGNGCDGFEAERRQCRRHVPVVVLARLGLLRGRELGPRGELHPVLVQPLAQLLEALPALQQHRIECGPQAEDVRIELLDHGDVAAGVGAGAHRADALHEEFVEVRGEDGQELEPLEQWHALVVRLGQHAAVELEPAEVPVEPGLLDHPCAQLCVHGTPVPAIATARGTERMCLNSI